MEKRQRKHEIHLRLNEKEYAALERNRKKCGLTQQTYLRKMCQKIQPRKQPPAEFFQVLGALNRIEIVLNEIAVTAESIGHIDADFYRENVNRLEQEMTELRNRILFEEG